MADEQEVETPAEEAVAVEDVQMSVLDALKEVGRRYLLLLLYRLDRNSLLTTFFIFAVFRRSLKRQKFMGGSRRDSTSAPKPLTAVRLASVVSPRIAKTKSTKSLSVPFVPKVRSTS